MARGSRSVLGARQTNVVRTTSDTVCPSSTSWHSGALITQPSGARVQHGGGRRNA